MKLKRDDRMQIVNQLTLFVSAHGKLDFSAGGYTDSLNIDDQKI